MVLSEFEEKIVCDRLEGWELVEFLQIPIGDILTAAYDQDWITEENFDDLLDFVGLKG